MHYFLNLTKGVTVMGMKMLVVSLIEHVLCAGLCADCFLCMLSPYIPPCGVAYEGQGGTGPVSGNGGTSRLIGLRMKRV